MKNKTRIKEELVEIAPWEVIRQTMQEVEPPIERETGVIGIDYTKINDFAAAGVLTKRGEKFVFSQHTWICANSADLPRIRFPYMEAVEAGEAEIVDAPEIPPELIADWVAEQTAFYNIEKLALDDYRFALMKKALERVGFTYENENIKLVRPSDKIKIEPIIDSAFRNQNIVYGDSPIMRWYTNNTKKVKVKKNGNYEYQKIEAKSRKTDGFFAFVAAMTVHELITEKTIGGGHVAQKVFKKLCDIEQQLQAIRSSLESGKEDLDITSLKSEIELTIDQPTRLIPDQMARQLRTKRREEQK